MMTRQCAGPNWFENLSSTQTPLLRLFCFPHAGGTSHVYRSWQAWFPEVELCLVHLPGRDHRVAEPAFTALIPLVAAIADRIPGKTDVPYAFYGHSMGALVSFELARELCRRREAGPRHLFVSGQRAPQWRRPEPKTFNLPAAEFIAELKKFQGTPEEVLQNRELINVFIDVLRADIQAVETYEYRPSNRLACSISVYGGIDDEHVPLESCHAWQAQTVGMCKVQMLKGDHFFVRNMESGFKCAFRRDILQVIQTLHQASQAHARNSYQRIPSTSSAVIEEAPQ